MATTKSEPKSFNELNIKDIIKKYIGEQTYVSRCCYVYDPEKVYSGIGDLVTMIKTQSVEIDALKDKIKFLERIVNQVFEKAEEK